MKDGQRIVFRGESNQVHTANSNNIITFCCIAISVQEPGYETGDIIIVLDSLDHPVFDRKGSDLHYVMVIMKSHYSSVSV